MIHQKVKSFKNLNRDIKALTLVLLAFLFIILIEALQFISEHQYAKLLTLLIPAITLLSTLLVVSAANRLIVNGEIVREDERRQEIVRTTHHLIAVTKDLKARVGFFKKALNEGMHPSFSLSQVAVTIENRYETLLERDAYKFLSGNCVDIITGISGDIFGIRLLAEGLNLMASDKPSLALQAVPKTDATDNRLEALMAELEKLLDELFKLRTSLDSEQEKKFANGTA